MVTHTLKGLSQSSASYPVKDESVMMRNTGRWYAEITTNARLG